MRFIVRNEYLFTFGPGELCLNLQIVAINLNETDMSSFFFFFYVPLALMQWDSDDDERGHQFCHCCLEAANDAEWPRGCIIPLCDVAHTSFPGSALFSPSVSLFIFFFELFPLSSLMFQTFNILYEEVEGVVRFAELRVPSWDSTMHCVTFCHFPIIHFSFHIFTHFATWIGWLSSLSFRLRQYVPPYLHDGNEYNSCIYNSWVYLLQN